MKVNVYLIFPNRVYYEMLIDKKDRISKIINNLQNIYPSTKYTYESKSLEPKFINLDTNEEIDISKTYEESGFCDTCNIKINLKILPKLFKTV